MSYRFQACLVREGKDRASVQPFVYVKLSDYLSMTNGNISISPFLMTTQEIDSTVNDLIVQLNEVRNNAKKLLLAGKL